MFLVPWRVRSIGVGADDPVERAVAVTVPVQATDEVATVLVAERDGDVLGEHLQLVDHVPSREVTGGEVETAVPARGGTNGLPLVGARAGRPMLAAQRHKTELALAREGGECLAGVRGRRGVSPQMILGRVETAGGRVELLIHNDPLTLEVHPLPAQRVPACRFGNGATSGTAPSTVAQQNDCS